MGKTALSKVYENPHKAKIWKSEHMNVCAFPLQSTPQKTLFFCSKLLTFSYWKALSKGAPPYMSRVIKFLRDIID